MNERNKYYKFIELFEDCQEKAVYAIRDLSDCKFRTAKIRTIITNIRFDGVNENFTEIEPYIDTINKMIDEGYNINEFLNKKKYKDLNDDEIFKIEEIDEIGLKKFKSEMITLAIDDKPLEYLYYREAALKEKANKEIIRVKLRNDDLMKKLRTRDKEILRLKHNKKKPTKKTFIEHINQLRLF